MSKITPFDYQKSTNIDEHNQIVDKVNEIVDVVNDIDLDGLGPRLDVDEANIAKNASDIVNLKTSDSEQNEHISTLITSVAKLNGDTTNLTTTVTKVEDDITDIKGDINEINGIDNVQNGNIAKNTSDISQLKISDTEHTSQISTLDTTVDNHAREITAIKAKDVSQDAKIDNLNTITDALTKELPTEITLYRDGTGKIKAQVTKEDETTFDSNTLDMIIPYQYDIIAGTTARSFKLQITMSNGDKVTTNDFLIPEGGGTDVTVTGVTLTKDSSNSNKIKVSINLSDGTPLESGYIEMVTAVSGSYANKKLTITVNGVSSAPITIDTSYTPGTGITISGGTISIDNTVVALKSEISDMETKTNANATFAKKTDISDMETKTNANATFATKSTVTLIQNAVGDCFNAVGLGSDGKSLDFTAVDGQVNNIAIPSSGSGATITSITGSFPSTLKLGSILCGDCNLSSSGAYDKLSVTLNMTCYRVANGTSYLCGIAVTNSILYLATLKSGMLTFTNSDYGDFSGVRSGYCVQIDFS